jgi:hypothetical protein
MFDFCFDRFGRRYAEYISSIILLSGQTSGANPYRKYLLDIRFHRLTSPEFLTTSVVDSAAAQGVESLDIGGGGEHMIQQDVQLMRNEIIGIYCFSPDRFSDLNSLFDCWCRIFGKVCGPIQQYKRPESVFH